MINGLDIYYSKNIGRGLKSVSKTASGLKPISTNKKVSGSGLKPISTNKKVSGSGLKPISNKGASCKKIGRGLKILQ